MKKTFCRILGLLLTLCLLAGMLGYLGELTRLKGDTNRYEHFLRSGQTYDVLFFGNSHMWDAVYPMEIWAETGIASYNMSYSGALMGGLYWIIRCALEHMSPQVIVLDTYLIDNEAPVLMSFFQDAMNAFPFSLNKIRAAYDLCPPGEFSAEDRATLIWGFSRFHSRWADLRTEDFHPSVNTGYGSYPLENVSVPDEAVRTAEALTLDDSYPNIPYLRRIAELCREKNIRLVLTTLPFPASREEAMAANGIVALAEELGVEYLNMLDMDLVDFNTDLFDSNSHLNLSGALKVTRAVQAYLRDNCALPDHRGDPAYADWDADYLLWRQELAAKLEEQPVLQRSLMLLSDPNYASVIRLAPGSPLFQDGQIKQLLENCCGAALPGFDEAAASGQSYLLLAGRSDGLVLEAAGTDRLETPLGDLRVEPERGLLTLGEEAYTLSAEGDQSSSDAMCFVFTTDMEPLPACSHAFARTVEGVYERCDY